MVVVVVVVEVLVVVVVVAEIVVAAAVAVVVVVVVVIAVEVVVVVVEEVVVVVVEVVVEVLVVAAEVVVVVVVVVAVAGVVLVVVVVVVVVVVAVVVVVVVVVVVAVAVVVVVVVGYITFTCGVRRIGRLTSIPVFTANWMIDDIVAGGYPFMVIGLDLSHASDRLNWQLLWKTLRCQRVSDHAIWRVERPYHEQCLVDVRFVPCPGHLWRGLVGLAGRQVFVSRQVMLGKRNLAPHQRRLQVGIPFCMNDHVTAQLNPSCAAPRPLREAPGFNRSPSSGVVLFGPRGQCTCSACCQQHSLPRLLRPGPCSVACLRSPARSACSPPWGFARLFRTKPPACKPLRRT